MSFFYATFKITPKIMQIIFGNKIITITIITTTTTISIKNNKVDIDSFILIFDIKQ